MKTSDQTILDSGSKFNNPLVPAKNEKEEFFCNRGHPCAQSKLGIMSKCIDCLNVKNETGMMSCGSCVDQ
jgi:hypothetical protein